MEKTKALWLRFWHCLSNADNFHKPEDHYLITLRKICGIPFRWDARTYIGCSCGKKFWGEKEY